MDVRSIQNLKRFFDEISKKMASSDKFFTGRLAVRLTKAASKYPTDQTVVQMAAFLNRRAEVPGGHLISKAELKDVYNRLYTTNTKAAEFLQDELGVNPNNLPEAHKTIRCAQEGEVIGYEKFADQSLVAEFESIFDKNVAYKPGFDPNVAKIAEKYVVASLPGQPKVEAIDGRDFAILCKASYETPKGQANVLIPVEVSGGKPLIPSVFLTNNGFIDLTKEALSKYIETTAGKRFTVNASRLFDVIKRVKFASTEKELDSVDRAVLALKAKSGTPSSYDPNGILYQTVDPEQKAVALSESKDVAKFAERLSTTNGSAEFVFGEKAVNTGRAIVGFKLKDAGYHNAQVKVSNFTNDSVTYSVAVNGSGFKVPVKMAKNTAGSFNAVMPSMLLAGGSVESLDNAGIKSALGKGDKQSFAAAVGLDTSSSQELVNEVDRACDVGDYERVGDIVGVLDQRGDETAFRYAFNRYLESLEGKKSIKTSTPNMKTVKIGGNIVEATTGLPVDQVYVDENGQVHRKYRKNMEKTEDVTAGGFMHSKIIMGL